MSITLIFPPFTFRLKVAVRQSSRILSGNFHKNSFPKRKLRIVATKPCVNFICKNLDTFTCFADKNAMLCANTHMPPKDIKKLLSTVAQNKSQLLQTEIMPLVISKSPNVKLSARLCERGWGKKLFTMSVNM